MIPDHSGHQNLGNLYVYFCCIMAFLRKSVGLKYFFNNVLNTGKHTTKDVEQSKILIKYSSNVNLAYFSSM